MFVNKINPDTGNPVCSCGKDCVPNVPGQPSTNGVVSGSKGLVILHNACVEEHNERVLAYAAFMQGHAECGMCHEIKAPATWCHDSEVGEYAVCGDCI